LSKLVGPLHDTPTGYNKKGLAAPSIASHLPSTSFSLTDKQREVVKLLGGPQRHTLLVGGSRSGKTFSLVRALYARAIRSPESRHCILRFRYNAVRQSVWLDTLPKMQRLCFPSIRYKEYRQDGFIELPSNGAQIWFGGLDEKERVEKILGMEFATLFCNECSQIPYSSVLVALTRLAQNAPNIQTRAYYDLNPTGTGHWTYKLFVEHKNPQTMQPLEEPNNYKWMYLNPLDNKGNLPEGYLGMLNSLPERQRKRFLEGKYTAEVDGALWTLETLETCLHEGPLPELRRVVIGVDPSGTAGKDDKRNDFVGIVAAGVDAEGTAYVLGDCSTQEGPDGWGRAVCNAFVNFEADAVVAEANFGGEMVRHVIQSCARNLGITVPTHLVTASRGKAVRAEPIAALYEQGKIKHKQHFPVLEDQLLNFSTNGWLGEKSPDRADAAIWALTHLLVRQHHGCLIVPPILATRPAVLLGDPSPSMFSGSLRPTTH